jgi:serine/threonine protein kinase
VNRKSDGKLFALKKVSLKKKTKDIYFVEKYKNYNFPNVVKIYDSFCDNDNNNYCIVMELCWNGSLFDFINDHIQNNVYIEETVFFFLFRVNFFNFRLLLN